MCPLTFSGLRRCCWVCGFLPCFLQILGPVGTLGELSRWIHHVPALQQEHRALHRRLSLRHSRQRPHSSPDTRVRTENRAACPRASPESTDHVHERRVPPPLHRPARLVRGVRRLHIPAPMLLLNSQLHAPFSTRPMPLAYFGTCLFWHLPFSTRVGATYTHPRTRRHGAPQSRNNLDGTGSGYSKGHSPVTALARHSARPSQRSPVAALARHSARPALAPHPSSSFVCLIKPY